MWKDTSEERLKRYHDCLRERPLFLEAARAVREGRTDELQEKGREIGRTEADVCDYVLSPALNGFVLWALSEAVKAGKERLYFLARDGYLMYRAAQIYCGKYRLPVECRYLSCSRYSLRIPAYHLDLEEALSYICRGGIGVTMEKILRRTGLPAKEREEFQKKLDIGFAGTEVIPYARLGEVREKLAGCGGFLDRLRSCSTEAMPALAGYLLQEGLLDGVPSALVDSGWVGSMQKILNRLLEAIRSDCPELPEIHLEGYYWGLYELPKGVNPADYHCYYFSPGGNLREKVYFSNCLFEGIFSAPHGMTLGYEEDAGSYRPIYAAEPPGHRTFMERLEGRLMRYTEELSQAPGGMAALCADPVRDRKAVRNLFSLFMGEPTRQEAGIYGELVFSDDVLEDGGQPMAAHLSRRDLLDNGALRKTLAFLGLRRGTVRESAWYEGSAVRAGHHVKGNLRRHARYKLLLYLRKRRIWRKRYG